MSKIQEALGRIQASRSQESRNSRYARNGENSNSVLARLVDRGLATESIVSSDRMLHIDREALRNQGLIAPEYHEELLGNQYREIKRPLIAHAFGKRATRVERGNVIMVTSAVAGEGKTFTSINLALSMAQERDHSVILVDADVAKPQISAMFDAADESGLLDIVESGRNDVRSAILPTDVPGLSILPAGRPRPNATELLSSQAMEDVISQLESMAGAPIVILDSPPLLHTSEAKVLSRLAGQILVIVRAGSTSRDAVDAALSILPDGQAVNLVLNQVRAAFSKFQYSYGYGYGYGAREGESRPDDSRSGVFE